MQIEIFYNGMNAYTRIIFDVADGGTLMSKTVEAAYALLEGMATNSYQWPNKRSSMKRVASLYEVDPITTLIAQMSSLTNQITTLTT